MTKSEKGMEWDLPLGILWRSISFSHVTKVAFKASVIFLFVPGVKGGTCAGKSEKKNRSFYYGLLLLLLEY